MRRSNLLFSTLLLLCALVLTAPATLRAQTTITPIADIQSSLNSGDDSAFVGQSVSVQGIVTGIYGSLFFVEEPAGGPWSGIAVFQRGHGVAEGDAVQVTGVVAEYYDLTQIEPTAVEILSSGNPLPAPAGLTAKEAAGEQWEGVLVHLSGLTVTVGPDSHGEWRVKDGSGGLLVDDKGVAFNAQPGQEIASIVAIVDHAFGSYRLIPRNLADIDAPTERPPVELPADLTPIYDIQGDGPETPLAGRDLNVLGIVTGINALGFYLQDPTGDDNPATSDGVYVYTARRPAVAVGDCVLVRQAAASEYYEKTELTEARSVATVEGCGSAELQPSPAPLAQRNQPPEEIFEPLEGMLVSVEGLTGIVQGPTKRFDSGDVEMALVVEGLSPYLPGGRVFQNRAGDADGLIFLSGGLGAELPDAAWGDRVTIGSDGGPVLAVLDYNFGKYQLMLLPGAQVTVEQANAVVDSLPATAEDAFAVCTFNVLGLGQGRDQHPNPDDYAQQLHKRAVAIAQGLDGCPIIGLQETGTPADAANLAQLLREEFDLPYAAVAIEGPNSSDRDFPLTNSLLVRTDRATVVAAESVQGCSRFTFGLRFMPGTCPPRQFAFFNRPPLVVDLTVAGPWGEYPLTVIVNHWKSKGGDESVNIVRRTYQAEHVAALVQARLDANPDAHIVVLGDLNDYYESGPVAILQEQTSPSLRHSLDNLSPADRYTYIFNGGSQALDHILYSQGLQAAFAGVDPLHINADFPVYGALDPTTIFRASDHDPVVLTLRPGGAGWIGGDVAMAGVGVELVDENGEVAAQTVSDSLGEFRLWGLVPGRYGLRYAPPAGTSVEAADTPLDVTAGSSLYLRPPVSQRRAELGAQAAVAGGVMAFVPKE
ncbi:MAG: endonuclease/exonuclease/phosphatase family protein [Caldilineaceae bacterium]|nr:endonuclease/exonuclease/phosphatase family protein [Caldilineaceae bacterium]